jgi:metal-dependent HD superfamily phosphatase/phosphodiesterase
MEMSLLLIAALLYVGFALGLILFVDNIVGIFFRDPRKPIQFRSFVLSRAFAASQKLDPEQEI